MATIVVHGTMTVSAAHHERWWWNSFFEGGFLGALASGMEPVSGEHDVWRVGGVPVSRVEELRPKWSLWTGRMGQISQHEGHFLWSGADMYVAREAGAKQLADYLAKIDQLAPGEPLRVVAHSHGCNVVKMASRRRSFPRRGIERAAFLACPHFEAKGSNDNHYPYRLEPSRFGEILNLYSPRDTVQKEFAETLAGPPGFRLNDFLPVKAHRTERDPEARGLCDNHAIETEADGMRAHSALHGAAVGELTGRWLGGGGSFDRILGEFGGARLPVPADDLGG